jgi:hypothetical protein
MDAHRTSGVDGRGGAADERARSLRRTGGEGSPHTLSSAFPSRGNSDTRSRIHDRGSSTRKQHVPRGSSWLVTEWSPTGYQGVSADWSTRHRVPIGWAGVRVPGPVVPRPATSRSIRSTDPRPVPPGSEFPTGSKPTFRTTAIRDPAESADVSGDRVRRRGLDVPVLSPWRRPGVDRGPGLLTSLAEQTILIDFS